MDSTSLINELRALRTELALLAATSAAMLAAAQSNLQLLQAAVHASSVLTTSPETVLQTPGALPVVPCSPLPVSAAD